MTTRPQVKYRRKTPSAAANDVLNNSMQLPEKF